MRETLKFEEVIPYEPEKYDAQNQTGLIQTQGIPTPLLFSCIRMWKLWRKKRLGYRISVSMKSMQREFKIKEKEERGENVKLIRSLEAISNKFFVVYESCVRRVLTYRN